MCTNYRPTSRDLIAERMGVVAPTFAYPEEAWPGYAAPILRRSIDGAVDRSDGGPGQVVSRECVSAGFGLVPFWSRDTRIARSTYNARAETARAKPAFRQAWSRGQWALVPMDGFYEPDYATGKALRWQIRRGDGAPFHVAALWDRWINPAGGEPMLSFTLLTHNADRHALMSRFHRPGEEKRSVIVIDDRHADEWLAATPDSAGDLLRAFDPNDWASEAAPLPPRVTAKTPS
ncbi:MAG: SOS response-associated peptidase family protein [Burkholderiaceae bacterium]